MKITQLFILVGQYDDDGDLIERIAVEVGELKHFLQENSTTCKVEGYFFKEFNDDDVDELKEENERLKDQLDSIDSKLDDALSWLEDVRYTIDDAKDDTCY